jgi:hypothetical protein
MENETQEQPQGAPAVPIGPAPSSSSTRSESIGKLAGALAKAQGQIEHASKDRENPHFHSKYATLASVWDACREQLAANELAVIQTVETVRGGEYAIVQTTLAHSSGEWITSRLVMRPVKSDPQGLGSAFTYGRRYGLSSIAGVAPDDDDDGNMASQGQNFRQPPPQQRTEPQRQAAPGDVEASALAEWGKRLAMVKDAKSLSGLMERAKAELKDNPALALEVTKLANEKRVELNGARQ